MLCYVQYLRVKSVTQYDQSSWLPIVPTISARKISLTTNVPVTDLASRIFTTHRSFLKLRV